MQGEFSLAPDATQCSTAIPPTPTGTKLAQQHLTRTQPVQNSPSITPPGPQPVENSPSNISPGPNRQKTRPTTPHPPPVQNSPSITQQRPHRLQPQQKPTNTSNELHRCCARLSKLKALNTNAGYAACPVLAPSTEASCDKDIGSQTQLSTSLPLPLGSDTGTITGIAHEHGQGNPLIEGKTTHTHPNSHPPERKTTHAARKPSKTSHFQRVWAKNISFSRRHLDSLQSRGDKNFIHRLDITSTPLHSTILAEQPA